jgi:hypothetical protein
MSRSVSLNELPGSYAVSRLDPSVPFPAWADGPGFVSITRSDAELSVVCLSDRVPDGVTTSAGWSCFAFAGPFAFDETGVVSSVIGPLSAAGIGIFVVSTFDGDHLLVRTQDVDEARRQLTGAGHRLE